MDVEMRSVRETQGDWLFHYTRLETALEYILPKLTMRLSPFSRMRDPREYSDWSVPTAGFIDGVSDADMARAWTEVSTRLNSLKDRFKLLSFTQDEADQDILDGQWGRGYCRSRLWELYANGGRGLCLVFHKQTAVEEILPQLETLGRAHHGSVLYSNKRLFEEIFVDLGEALKGNIDTIVEEKLARHMDALFLTKNVEWQSENEYRFIVETADDAPVHVDVTNSLVGVCMGPLTPREYFPSIRTLCEAAHLSLGQLMWWNNDPLLIGVRVELAPPGAEAAD
jgi:hypothetical protein